MKHEHDELIAAYAAAWDAENSEKWAVIYRGHDMFKEIDERIAFAIKKAYEAGQDAGQRISEELQELALCRSYDIGYENATAAERRHDDKSCCSY